MSEKYKIPVKHAVSRHDKESNFWKAIEEANLLFSLARLKGETIKERRQGQVRLVGRMNF